MSAQIEKILRTAVEYGASDVFISCGSQPTLRINGQLVAIKEHSVLDERLCDEYVHYLASASQIDSFTKTKDLDFSVQVENLGRFRVNMFVQHKGNSIVLRPIPHTVQSIDELGLAESLKAITRLESGLVLVTGPTGSGKSTTLASMIHEINTHESAHIITIEDPIEFIHDNMKSLIEQREVKTHSESFGTALRAALREDPDVILVGEMRDLETIALAVTAAETGHLVFGTLHTSGAANTIDRIIDVFPPNQQSQIKTQLAMSLRAVVWQKLIHTADEKRRIAALEIMMNTSAIANLIRKGATHQIYSTMEMGMRDGMQTMATALRDLTRAGTITEAQASYHLGEVPKAENDSTANQNT